VRLSLFGPELYLPCTLLPESARVFFGQLSPGHKKLLFTVLLQCGLRLQEIQTLRWVGHKDVQSTMRHMAVLQKKDLHAKMALRCEPKITSLPLLGSG
jgi:hypothetical protein